MALKRWRSMDIFNFSARDNPIMESVQNKFAQISQSHAGTLLRNKRLGSLSSVRSEENVPTPRRDEPADNTNPVLLQRTAIVQKDEKGYGLTVSGDNPVYVASVKPGGAAERAGVQEGDKIIKVNGKLVTNSNHLEVVKMIRATSLVQLTLLGKPSSHQQLTSLNRESGTEDQSGQFRHSFCEKITGPQPVDAEKERDLQREKVNTLRGMYELAQEEFEKLKKAYKSSPSEKLNSQIQEKEKTLKVLEAQLNNQPHIQGISSNVDESLNTSDHNSSVASWLPKTERRHVKHSSSPGAMFQTSEPRGAANVCRSKSDVSSRKNTLSEFAYSVQGYKRTDSSPESTNAQESATKVRGKKVKKSASFKGFGSFRKKSNRTNSFRRKFSKPKMTIRKTSSVPTVDMGSFTDSTHTSPSTSPTPEVDLVTMDSGIEDGSQNSIVMSRTAPQMIIGQDDDDFASEDESTGDSKVFQSLKQVESKPAHMAIFLHYVLYHHNPSPLLFYQMAGVYSQAQGNSKDLKKWAYEIHSTFLVHQAPLKLTCIKDYIIQEIDGILQFRSEKEESLRGIFSAARREAAEEVQKLLEDLCQKKEQGLIEGSNDIKDSMDKNEEVKIVEKYLLPDLEKFMQNADTDERETAEKYNAQSWALATFLRQVGLQKSSSHAAVLERTQSFVTKDKQAKARFLRKTKSYKGHQFQPVHLSKQEFCLHCNKVLWGVGFQGYQCTTCEQCVHKQCVEELDEVCSKKKKRQSTLGDFFKKPTPQATPLPGVSDGETVGSPTHSPMVEPLKDPEDKDLSLIKEGHSVGSLVDRFEARTPEEPSGKSRLYRKSSHAEFSPRHNRRNAISPSRHYSHMDYRQNRRPSGGYQTSVSYPAGYQPPRKTTDLGRSESMKGRGDQRDRPTRRSKSDVDMDASTLKEITSATSSSTSSLRSMDSPSTSLDTIVAQDDSDFDVEPELPPLKQVLGEETVRKLKPKEKKRQDVINELFYTEKCHVRNLKILDKLFYKPLLKESSIPQEFTRNLFPNLETMILLHSSLNKSMKNRRKEKTVISACGDLLCERFDGEPGENFRNGCAIFCRNQSHMLETLKAKVRKETKLAQLLSDAENNPLCQRLALKDIIPKQFMRLTKYPLLIENLLKYTQTNTEEYTKLQTALQCSKHILEYVNQAVKDCENHQRLIDLQRRIDKKLDNSAEVEEIKHFDISKHKLVHDGSLTWRINNRKSIELYVVLLERAMVLLQKQEEKLVLKLQSTQLVSGTQDSKRHSPLLWLNNVLARNDATDKRAFFVVNTSKAGPQIYQLVASSADDQKRWTKYITQASEAMKKSEINLKKKPPVVPVEPPVPTINTEEQEPEENNKALEYVELENPETLVNPDDVQTYDPVISDTGHVISPLEKLRQNDESMAALLNQRLNIIAELLNVTPESVPQRVQKSYVSDNSQELITACQFQMQQWGEIIQQQSGDTVVLPQSLSGEQVESVEDLTLPIPMDKLRDMANRMNQILTNLLAQTRAVSTPMSSTMSQAAVNSQDEERERLRRELKFAQDELNRLRRIKQLQMEANKLQEEGEEVEKPERPVSLVSEASTVSESDENRDDSEVTDDTEIVTTLEDGMPGLPIEPETISEVSSATLSEVSPGIIDTLQDFETPDFSSDTGVCEEAELPDTSEEVLHEVEPPEEELMEDDEVPTVELIEPSDADDSDDDKDDKMGDEIADVDKVEEASNACEEEEAVVVKTEDAKEEELQVDAEDDDNEEVKSVVAMETESGTEDADKGAADEADDLEVLERLQPTDGAAADSDSSSGGGEGSRDRDSAGFFYDALDDNSEAAEPLEDPGGDVQGDGVKNSEVTSTCDDTSAAADNEKPPVPEADKPPVAEADICTQVNDASAQTSNNNEVVDKVKETPSEAEPVDVNDIDIGTCVDTGSKVSDSHDSEQIDDTVTSLSTTAAEQI